MQPDADNKKIWREKSEKFISSQWPLLWRKFKKHRLAFASALILALFCLVAIFCEFISPNSPQKRNAQRIYAPRQKIHFFDEDGFHWRPFVYGIKGGSLDENWIRSYEENKSKRLVIRFFVRGDSYKLLGLIRMDRHLFGLAEKGQTLYLLGGDDLGKDLLSQILYGSRVSLSIGLVGVFLSLLIGCVVGGVSGYLGGAVDTVIQRVIEMMMSLPRLPLWMGLGAALPVDWPPLWVYFGMVVILSLIGWTGLARVVRGKVIALREEDFAMAARLAGASEARIIRKHLLPAFMSYLIVNVTLAVPAMILAETTLSWLNLGLKAPVVSWGVLLQKAQSVQIMAEYPWILSPAIFVIIVVLAFNFLGDGLRDAADPNAR